jgi:O-antigen ligase
MLALPWLWPFTPGPSPAVTQLLVAWACLLPVLACLATPAWRDAARAAIPRAWLVAALVNAAIGLAQWARLDPEAWWFSASQLGQAYGNLRQRNQFASLMAIGLLVLVFHPGPRRAWHPWAVLLLALGVAASASRTGLLQWVLIGGLAAAWPGPRRARLWRWAGALAAALLALAVLPRLLYAWRGIEAVTAIDRALSDLGCSSRRVLWSNVLDLVALRPWTGWGVGELDYAHFIVPYAGARFCDILDNAHNLPLHLAVELGLPAAALVCGGLLAVAWRARPWRDARPQAALAWSVLVLVGVHSLVEYPLWYGPFQSAVLLAAALAWRGGARPPRLPAPVLQRGAWAGTVLGIAALGAVALQYDRVSDAYRPAPERRAALRADPIAGLQHAWPFQDQVRFAELSLLQVDRATAPRAHVLAARMLHFSPEPMVIEKLLDSARLLGREEEAAAIASRYAAAFPREHQQWLATTTRQ